MKKAYTTPRVILLILLAVVIVLFLVISFWNITSASRIGGVDFTGYWSATYLLHKGENPYSPELMTEVQRALPGSGLGVTIMAWNPPFLFAFLLPLAWMPFSVAKFVWLLLNIIMITTAAFMLARLYIPDENPHLKLAFTIFAIVFPAVLAGIYMGQVTFLVFWGLVASVWLIKKDRWFWAGAVLVLTTVKPHMVLLPVLYLLIYMTTRRQLLGWVGLISAGVVCLAVLLFFRFNLIFDLLGETSVAQTSWATPTIGGFVSYLGIRYSAHYLILLFIPLPFYLALSGQKYSLEFSVALLTLITVPTTVFGWSYDQTMLLIPIAQVFGWLARSRYKILIIGSVAVAAVINYYQRWILLNEVLYIWIPIFWCIIFYLAWHSLTSTDTQNV